jgi:hypothetical protein
MAATWEEEKRDDAVQKVVHAPLLDHHDCILTIHWLCIVPQCAG